MNIFLKGLVVLSTDRTPLEFEAIEVICSIWLSKVWLNWLFPYVICVGVVITMELGWVVPLPKLSDIAVRP